MWFANNIDLECSMIAFIVSICVSRLQYLSAYKQSKNLTNAATTKIERDFLERWSEKAEHTTVWLEAN